MSVGYFALSILELGKSNMQIDHCIDDIRQALMCHADTSITTFEWKEGIRRPMPDFAGYVTSSSCYHQNSPVFRHLDSGTNKSSWHTCNNWEKLDDWATARAFSMFDQVSLINPTYGELFIISIYGNSLIVLEF